MNDLTQYNAVKHQMRPGDLIAFWGAHPISFLINLFATGPSHVAVVRQDIHEQSANSTDVTIIESTINPNGGARVRNGVQTNQLGKVLAEYGSGARAAWLPLSEESRRRLDLMKFFA